MEVKYIMVEITNLDAIIELILREARAVKSTELSTRAYMVLGEIANRLGDIIDNVNAEERRKKEDENKC